MQIHLLEDHLGIRQVFFETKPEPSSLIPSFDGVKPGVWWRSLHPWSKATERLDARSDVSHLTKSTHSNSI